MCPIHDTDSSEERWSKAEWEHYELWEKKEAQIRSQKRWGIFAGFLVFLILSAVPVVMDRALQWKSLRAMRELGLRLNQIKRQAASRNTALKVSVDPQEPLLLRVEQAAHCRATDFKADSEIRLLEGVPGRELLTWLDPLRGQEVGIPGVVTHFCYDPRGGSSVTPGEQSLAAFVILPAKELTAQPERHAVLLIRGPSAEISFE